MTKQEAFTIVTNVCVQYKGTRQDHQIIAEALGLLDDTRTLPPETPPKPDKPSKAGD